MIKFISYDGAYPNLCSGTLVLELDGTRYECDDILSSGGHVRFDSDWNEDVGKGEWEVRGDELPEELQPHAREIAVLVNEKVAEGCCGGCV